MQNISPQFQQPHCLIVRPVTRSRGGQLESTMPYIFGQYKTTNHRPVESHSWRHAAVVVNLSNVSNVRRTSDPNKMYRLILSDYRYRSIDNNRWQQQQQQRHHLKVFKALLSWATYGFRLVAVVGRPQSSDQ